MQATLRTETNFFPRKVGTIEIKWDIGSFNIFVKIDITI